MNTQKISIKGLKNIFHSTAKASEGVLAQISQGANEMINNFEKLQPVQILKYIEESAQKIESSINPQKLHYKIEGTFFHKMNAIGADSYEAVLKALNYHEVTCVPKFLKHKKVAEGEYITISTTGFKDLLSFNKVFDNIPQKTKQEFFTDMLKLNKLGYANDEIIKNPNIMFVTPDYKHIIVSDWSAVRPAKSNESTSNIEELKKVIFRK